MNKGINTIINESKDKLVNAVNEVLQAGVPISVVYLIIDGILREVQTSLQNHLQQEAKQMAEQEKIKSQQVEWTPEEQS